MPPQTKSSGEHRAQPRLKLPPMYTHARVRSRGTKKYAWSGHIYDISLTGLRFELDCPLDPGAEVDVQAALPGSPSAVIQLSGHVVRYHDDPDEPGPMRMGMVFDKFTRPIDRRRLHDYLLNYNPTARAA